MATAGYLFNEKPPVGLLVAQAVGLTASTFLFGQNAAMTIVFCPAVLQAPAPLAARQWATVYTIGKKTGPALALTSSLAIGYVAYKQDPASLPFKLNLAAALIIPSIMPFTILFMKSTNEKLFAKRDALLNASLEDKAVEASASGETVHQLIDKWGTLNLARALIVGVGAVMAICAAIDKREAVGFKDLGLTTGANRIS